MALSDQDIQEALDSGELSLGGLGPGQIQPASVDLRLGENFSFWPPSVESKLTPWFGGQPFPEGFQGATVIDLGMPGEDAPRMSSCRYPNGFALAPRQFALGHTVEQVHLGKRLRARVEGKSSLGRFGLMVHATAGFIDPGFQGSITLEFYNLSPHTIILRPGVPICQLAFDLLVRPAVVPYGPGRGSKYQGQDGAQQSRWKG